MASGRWYPQVSWLVVWGGVLLPLPVLIERATGHVCPKKKVVYRFCEDGAERQRSGEEPDKCERGRKGNDDGLARDKRVKRLINYKDF